MAMGQLSKVLRDLQLSDAETLTDGQLLERFLVHRDETAFAALVRRHGPMVLGVCRRILANPHDAEDAFQATFLVLIRKAASFRLRSTVGNFLHGVAYHTARKARAAAWTRRAKEAKVSPMPQTDPTADAWPDLQPLLDQELPGCPTGIARRLCCATWKGKRARKRPGSWACRRERSPAG